VLTVVDASQQQLRQRKSTVTRAGPRATPDQFLTASGYESDTPRTFQVAVVPQSSPSRSADRCTPVYISSFVRSNTTRNAGAGGVPTTPTARADCRPYGSIPPGCRPLADSASLRPVDLPKPWRPIRTPELHSIYRTSMREDLVCNYSINHKVANRPPAIEHSTAAAARIAQQLVPADVDHRVAFADDKRAAPGTLYVSPGSGAAAGAILRGEPCWEPMGLPAAKPVRSCSQSQPSLVSADDLHTNLHKPPPNFAETADTAANYYKSHRPGRQRSSCAADAEQLAGCQLLQSFCNQLRRRYRAVYTNNFDLGFGPRHVLRHLPAEQPLGRSPIR